MNILWYLREMKVVTGPLDVEVAQFFEGKAVVRKYMEKRGYRSVAFDIEKSQYHDANSSCGLIGMVSGCGRLREGSLTHWDTPCSTWVFMCRAQTQRSLLEPEGPRPCTRIPCVDWAKQQVSRMAAMWLRLRTRPSWCQSSSGSTTTSHPSQTHTAQPSSAGPPATTSGERPLPGMVHH